MTCAELHIFLSGTLTEELPIAAAVHLEQCAACRHAAADRAKLAADLRLLRDVAPLVPKSLDSEVLVAFRLRSSVPSVLSASGASYAKLARKRVAILFAVPAIAAALLIAAILIAVPSQPEPMQVWSAPTPQAPMVAHTTKETATPRAHPEFVAKKNRPAPSDRDLVARGPANQPDPTAAVPVSGFQSLMFCDSLSCPGAMDVVRIQIPASAVNRLPASRMANGYVQADVVVGPDGFARAIRIVH